MPHATFFLSTGRCGTQWLAQKLSAAYGDRLRVEHEPLHLGYRPRQMLGLKTPLALDSDSATEILNHVSGIEGTLETRDYVECGHPCWSTLPYLAHRLKGRIRIVHLVRHPIPTACSWLTHQAYTAPLLPHLQEKVLLSPFDLGACFPEYQQSWITLTPFEKCLYYWTEIQAFGLRLEHSSKVPWIRLAFENLFTEPALGSLLDFLELPPHASIFEARREVVDEYRFIAHSGLLHLNAVAHPALQMVAANLGYDLADIDAASLEQRYFGLRLA